jgi:type IX secretion system PorP/SprF family membrane protein
MKKKLPALIFILHFAFCIGYAQDVHFSQYWESNVLRNPGFTGICAEDFKAGGIYRNQWNSLGNPYQTMAFSAEGRFAIRHSRSDYVTVAAIFFSDKAGRASLKTTGIYPAVNYNKCLSDPHHSYLSLGFTVGYLQRSFDPGKLTFDNQYQNGTVEPSAGPGEDLPYASMHHLDLGAGLSYNSSIGSGDRINYILGISAYHFTQPKSNFSQNASTLVNIAMRLNGSFGLNFQINDVWSAQFHGNLAFEGAYREQMLGGMLQWARSDENGKGFGLSAGAQMRFGDAIIPMIRLDFKHQSFGISYDINTSALKAATSMRGGIELTAFIKGFFRSNGGDDSKRDAPRF